MERTRNSYELTSEALNRRGSWKTCTKHSVTRGTRSCDLRITGLPTLTTLITVSTNSTSQPGGAHNLLTSFKRHSYWAYIHPDSHAILPHDFNHPMIVRLLVGQLATVCRASDLQSEGRWIESRTSQFFNKLPMSRGESALRLVVLNCFPSLLPLITLIAPRSTPAPLRDRNPQVQPLQRNIDNISTPIPTSQSF